MSDFIFSLLQAVIIAAVPVITGFLCKFLAAKKSELAAKIDDENAKRLLEEACDAVMTAVICTNQTYVDALKKNGTFSMENQKEAFQKSYETALSIMSVEARDLIEELYGDVQTWLTAKIEAAVKQEKPAAA